MINASLGNEEELIMNIENTKFSIYKIDKEKTFTTFGINEKDINTSKLVDLICKGNINYLKNRDDFKYIFIDNTLAKGIVFRTSNKATWSSFISEMFSEDIDVDFQFDIKNTNYSYVLYLNNNDDNIYAVTGGYGSNVIKKYTEL
jgi:hypothetical protein